MDAEQLRNQRFDRALDRIAKRELKVFRQETLERRKAESQESQPLNRLEPEVPVKGKR